MKAIYVVGTADTKGEELAHIAALIRALGASRLPSMSASAPRPSRSMSARARSRAAAMHLDATDRGQAVETMAAAFASSSPPRSDIGGIIGIGGGGGTSIVTAGMRRCPSASPSSWSRRSPRATSRPMSASATSS